MIIKRTQVLLACLVLALGLGGALIGAPSKVSALNDDQKKECRKTWGDGKSYDLSNDKDVKKLNEFKKTKCYADKGGNCRIETFRTSIDSDGKQKQIARINCDPKTANTSGSKGNNSEGITDPALTSGGCTDVDCPFIDSYINPAIKLLSAAVGIAAVIAIIIGAIQISTSAGDPQKVTSGKNHIRNALIGMVAYVVLFIFLNWIIPGGIV